MEERSEAAETRHRHHHSHEVGLGGGLGLPLGLGLGALGLIGTIIFILAKYFIIVCCYSAQEFLWPLPPAQLRPLRWAGSARRPSTRTAAPPPRWT